MSKNIEKVFDGALEVDVILPDRVIAVDDEMFSTFDLPIVQDAEPFSVAYRLSLAACHLPSVPPRGRVG